MNTNTKDRTENRQFTVLVSDQMSEEGLKPVIDSDKVQVVLENVLTTSTPLEEVDALIIRSATTVTAEIIKKMPNLKIIGRAGVGVDNVDLEAATANGVVVVNAPDGNTISTAEHTFAMLASVVRNIPQANQSMKEGRWDRKLYTGTELFGKTLGIVGFGRIGAELASRARAFKMNVVAYDPFLTESRAEKNKVTIMDLDELLEKSDFVTVHTPLTKETKGMISSERLKRMKNSAFLLNCARGGIIDEDALYNAIKSGELKGAAIDVYESEPAKNHPLAALEQVITTPHIAASTDEAQLNVAEQVAVEVLEYLQGKPAPHALNLPHIDAEEFEKMAPITSLTKILGETATQLFREPVKEVEMHYAGELSHQETGLFNRSFLAGFFKHRVDSYVNEVNSVAIAKEREINVSEKHSSESYGYSNMIGATIKGEKRELFIVGTYSKEFGPRIVKIDDFSFEFQPGAHTLFVQHFDKPGVIGKVGQLLGTHDVNIATMQVGRHSQGGKAIMLLGTDKGCNNEVIKAFESFDEVESVQAIEL